MTTEHKPHSELLEHLDEFIKFGEEMSPDVGPMFGRDAARIGRAYRDLVEQYEELGRDLDGKAFLKDAAEAKIRRLEEQLEASERRADAAVAERQKWEAETHRVEDERDRAVEGIIAQAAKRQDIELAELKEQLEALRRHAENVRDGWLIIDGDDAHLMHACEELDKFLVASSPATGSDDA